MEAKTEVALDSAAHVKAVAQGASYADHDGEFNNLCTMGLAGHKIMRTDCSVNTSYEGKTYCFSNEQDKAAFLKDPSANVAKAEAFYKTHPQG